MEKRIGRHIILVAGLLVASMLLALSGCSGKKPAAEQKFPTKPITVINHNSAGGPGDVDIRGLQPYWEKLLGQPIVQEYVTAGSGKEGIVKGYKAKPDGYTLLYISMPAALNQEIIYDEKEYKTADFVYLQNMIAEYRLLAILPNKAINSIEDLIKAGKAKKLSIGHSGIGSSAQMQSILIQKKLGLEFKEVPFQGLAPSKAAFLGGHVDLWTPDVVSAMPMVKSGEIKALAVHAPQRIAELPDVPTFKELGYDGMEVYTARGFVAPPNLDPKAKEVLIDTLKKAAADAEFKKWADTSKKTLRLESGDGYKKMIDDLRVQIEKIAPVIKEGMTKDK